MPSYCATPISGHTGADARHPTRKTQELTSRAVKAEAQRLGFSLVGIAPAERFTEAEGHLVEWVRRGRHGQMGWIDESRVRHSCRPDQLLPGAKSIVALGAAYPSGGEREPPPLRGRVARYARGRDYHDVMKARLWELVAFLRQRAGLDVRCRVFVDTGPLVDREAAVQAGLGFYGKNTCLLAPAAGSYVLLGAILTDLTLQPDGRRKGPTDCGSCSLCLEACPTGALSAPYQLDARLCISYLTIELRGPIPRELRPKLGARVFGCDICQEVCPWNRGRGLIPWPEFAGRSTTDDRPPTTESRKDLDLLEVLDLDEQAFRERFRGSPIKRAKRRGLLRNAAVALGNSGDPRAVATLARALTSDPDPLVRSHAAWALRQLGGDEAKVALAAALTREQDPGVRAEIEPDTASN